MSSIVNIYSLNIVRINQENAKSFKNYEEKISNLEVLKKNKKR